MSTDLLKIKDTRQMREFVKASHITNILSRTYPNFAWMSAEDSRAGVIKILEKNFMDSTIPYIIRLEETNYSEKALHRAVVKAGGEILERYYLPRERMALKKVQSRVDNLPQNFAGKVLFDHRGNTNWLGEKA